MSERQSKERMKCVAEKKFYLDNIKRLQTQAESEIHVWSAAIVDERLTKLQRDFKSLETKVKQIVCGEFTEEEKNAAQTELSEGEALMFDLVDKLKSQHQMQNTEREISVPKSQEIKANATQAEVPKINAKKENFMVMKFNGEMAEWQPFRSWFERNVVNNAEINANKKLEILRESVSGTEVETLVNIDDFEEACVELYNTFNATYRVVQQNFRELKRLPALQQASSESIGRLIKAVDVYMESVRQKIPDFSDTVSTLIVIDKLDHATQLAWERHLNGLSQSWAQSVSDRKASNYIPDWPSLRDFLKSEAKIYLAVDHNKAAWNTVVKSKPEAKFNASEASTSGQASGSTMIYTDSYGNVIKCYLCGKNHKVAECRQLLDASIEQRELLFEEFGWCKKCIKPAHANRPCKNPKCNDPCPRCGNSVYHNSVLCVNSPQATKQIPQAKLEAKQQSENANEDDWNDDYIEQNNAHKF